MKSQKGFTLVEMAVTIALIAIVSVFLAQILGASLLASSELSRNKQTSTGLAGQSERQIDSHYGYGLSAVGGTSAGSIGIGGLEIPLKGVEIKNGEGNSYTIFVRE